MIYFCLNTLKKYEKICKKNGFTIAIFILVSFMMYPQQLKINLLALDRLQQNDKMIKMIKIKIMIKNDNK